MRFWLELVVLCSLLVARTGHAEIPLGKNVYRMDEIQAAQEEAKAKGKAITFLYTDENTKCGLCIGASMDVVQGMKARSVVVYVNSNNQGPLLPALVREALGKPEAGQYIPKTIVVDPDITEVIAIIPYDSEQARKASITKAKRAVAKALGDDDARPGGVSAQAQAAAGGVRTWTSASGAKLEGEFAGCSLDNVTLRKSDGGTVQIHITKLSPQDQAVVRTLQKAGVGP